MKRIKTEIALTFVILVIIRILIIGLFNVFISQCNFITSDLIVNVICGGAFYLAYIWSETRRHPTLCFVSFVAILFVSLTILIVSIPYFYETLSQPVSSFRWIRTIISMFYYMILYIIAQHQSKKLIKLLDDKKSSTKG